ncbi:loricrin-like [Penaeus japonicus]|uniref:loricrin-like n=1 Tax=Penaeus japonicus TaxID=27405 RepID=UPI001C7102A2|nr:loricrin-like [Penaeus japonicus]
MAAPQGYSVGRPSGPGSKIGDSSLSFRARGSGPGFGSGGYGHGQVLHVDGRCVTPRVNRKVYLYDAPPAPVSYGPPPYIPEPTIDTNIVFIRTPEGGHRTSATATKRRICPQQTDTTGTGSSQGGGQVIGGGAGGIGGGFGGSGGVGGGFGGSGISGGFGGGSGGGGFGGGVTSGGFVSGGDSGEFISGGNGGGFTTEGVFGGGSSVISAPSNLYSTP